MEDQEQTPGETVPTPSTPDDAGNSSLPAQTPPPAKRRQQTAKPRKQHTPRAGLSWPATLLLVVLVLGVAGIVVKTFFWSRPVDPVERGVWGLVLALFVAAIIYVGIGSTPTSAIATGQLNLGLFRMKWRTLGPGATFAITFASFMYFTAGAYQTIDVRLFKPDGTLLEKDFKVSWFHPDTGSHDDHPGHNGSADLRGLPVGVSELDLAINCPGYKVKDRPPYPIKDRTIRVIMIPDVNPPLMGENFPYIDPAMVPDQKTVDQQPKTDPKLVTFHRQNLTGEDLTLLAWDCYKRYHPSTTLAGSSKWISFPFKTGPEQIFERFEKGSGWFIFYVQDAAGQNHFLAKRAIFESRNPSLTVTRSGDHFIASFLFDK